MLEPASGGGVYDVIPAQEVDLSAQREAIIGQKVNASYDKETGAVTPGHAGVEFTLSDLESAYNAAAAGETVELPNATVETPDVTAEQRQVLFRDVLSTPRKVGASGRRRGRQADGLAHRRPHIELRRNDEIRPARHALYRGGTAAAPRPVAVARPSIWSAAARESSKAELHALRRGALPPTLRSCSARATASRPTTSASASARRSRRAGPSLSSCTSTMYPIKVVAESTMQSGGKNYLKVSLLGTKGGRYLCEDQDRSA
ncbi:MAG: hypothetical protein ACLRSD_08790 [Oscillibacter sp.]